MSTTEARAEAAETAFSAVLTNQLARMQGVTLSRMGGPKARKDTRWWKADEPFEVKAVDPTYVVPDKLAAEVEDALRPVALRVAMDAAADTARRLGVDPEPGGDNMFALDQGLIAQAVEDAVSQILGVTQRQAQDVRAAILEADKDAEDLDGVLDRIEAAYRRGGNWVLMSGRTLANALVNEAALLQAQALGVTHAQWLSKRDARVRATHRIADGQVRALGDKFRVGLYELRFPGDPAELPGSWEEIANCFIGETVVSASDVEGSFRLPYSGEVVTIRSASGRILTGTPNHPVLTERGWVALGKIQQGDHVVCAVGRDDRSPGVDPDMQNGPAAIEQVHHALAATGTGQRISSGGVNFHGDQAVGEVEVVAADRVLDLRGHTTFDQQDGQRVLVGRGPAVADTADGDGPLVAFGVGGDATAHGGVGSVSDPGAALGTESVHSDLVRGATSAWLNLGAQQAASDGGAVDPEVFGQRLLAFTGEVSTDEIVHVERSAFAGHVYDLQTRGGSYTASGMVVHNCRCGLLFAEPSESHKDAVRQLDEASAPGELSDAAARLLATPGPVVVGEPVVGFRALPESPEPVPGQWVTFAEDLSLSLVAPSSWSAAAPMLAVLIGAGTTVVVVDGAVTLAAGTPLEVVASSSTGVQARVVESEAP